MPTTDPTFVEDFTAVVRKLLQAHEREVFARANADAVGPGADVKAAHAVTEAAICELAMTIDDRFQHHTVGLVRSSAGPHSLEIVT